MLNSSADVLCAESQKWSEVDESPGQGKFSPLTKMIDEESRFLAENYQDLADAGLLALMVPREFGGNGEKTGSVGARLSSRAESGADHQRSSRGKRHYPPACGGSGSVPPTGRTGSCLNLVASISRLTRIRLVCIFRTEWEAYTFQHFGLYYAPSLTLEVSEYGDRIRLVSPIGQGR